jgi:hypothetical protein
VAERDHTVVWVRLGFEFGGQRHESVAVASVDLQVAIDHDTMFSAPGHAENSTRRADSG